MRETDVLRQGGVGIIATDTLYGLVARAQDERAVERVYALKGRHPEKPCIILISSPEEVGLFGVSCTSEQERALARYWPGPVSVVLPCPATALAYLHRGVHSLAFRLPASESLIALISETGPLIAPSANPEGEPPATTIAQARAYFGETVDCYLDGGTRAGRASRLISLAPDGSETVLRA